MVTAVEPYMEVENDRNYIDELFSDDPVKKYSALLQLKNFVIGSNRAKTAIVDQGLVPHLVNLLADPSSSEDIQTETAITLNSLGKGTDYHVEVLFKSNVVPVLLNRLVEVPRSQRLTEACLKCVKTLFISPHAPTDDIFTNAALVSRLMCLLPRSVVFQECIVTILTAACKRPECQDVLHSHNCLQALAPLLVSHIPNVQIAALKCLANLCYRNKAVSDSALTVSFGGRCIPEHLVTLMGRDHCIQTQIQAARCMTYLQRAGSIPSCDSAIVFRTLPSLVRMCKKDKSVAERVQAAETLAYLIEVDTELQRIASISDHLISNLADYFKYDVCENEMNGSIYSLNSSCSSLSINSVQMKMDDDVDQGEMLKQAAFKVFASLGANDEEIRKKVIDTNNLMSQLISSLNEGSLPVKLASVRCLHSLSRSVQQLRTTFQDHAVWEPLMKLLRTGSDDVLVVASSTLCNLLLEFSPSKEPILDAGAIELICRLTSKDSAALRLNGIWALMNMAFQTEQKIKSQILNTLGTDQIFRLLVDPDVNVLMKTLGLLRNLLSTKSHIDNIMNLYGKQIMQAVILILEGDHPAEVKEQALCILANIADGVASKNFIMTNEDVLKKLTNYMMHSNVRLQIAATFCISNLIWKEDDGAQERQQRLKEMGLHKLLQQLLTASDITLFDKVKTALQQFS